MELYPFRYRDPLTGKWVRARYVAERHEIAARYNEWEIIGAPGIRQGGDARHFNPYRPTLPRPPGGDVDQAPTLDAGERWLVLLFLRRYVTWCATRSIRTGRRRGAFMADAPLTDAEREAALDRMPKKMQDRIRKGARAR